MRLLDNCSLDADKVRGIMDDLDYYVDSNQVDCIQWCQISVLRHAGRASVVSRIS